MLELGCGLGLPAIAAALGGGRVLATDWAPDAVAMTARNAARNGAPVETRRVPLGRRARAARAAVAARARLRRALRARATSRRCSRCCRALTAAGGEVWLADPGRAPAARFLAAAARTRGASTRIPHDGPAHVTVHRPAAAGDAATRRRRSDPCGVSSALDDRLEPLQRPARLALGDAGHEHAARHPAEEAAGLLYSLR